MPWELPDDSSQPPPQKRTKSSELYRKQHGLLPDDVREPIIPIPLNQHPLTRERDRSKDNRDKELRERERERDRSLELRESLLGQALEGGPTLIEPLRVSVQNIVSKIYLKKIIKCVKKCQKCPYECFFFPFSWINLIFTYKILFALILFINL